jgi:hypothetical protein
VRSLALLESVLLLASIGCQSASPAEQKLPPAPTRMAGKFVCRGDDCRQEQPRLPDTGEWRCAEHGKVVWCAGGEPAAGVVAGAPDLGFRCAVRWGKSALSGERVCIDRSPDYPNGARAAYDCAYDQELSMARVCKKSAALAEPLPPGAEPACWLSKDCPSGRCDRGVCSCQADADCVHGHCKPGGACGS